MKFAIIIAAAALAGCGNGPGWPVTRSELKADIANAQAGIDQLQNSINGLRADLAEPTWNEGELGEIERECAWAQSHGGMPGWDCGFGGLADARRWREAYRSYRRGVLERRR